MGLWHRGPPACAYMVHPFFLIKKKLRSSHGRPPGPASGGGCPLALILLRLQRIFRVFTRKTLILAKFFLSKKDTPVSEILTTRMGIHNARAKSGAMARDPPACAYKVHPFKKKKKLRSSHGRPPGPASGGGCPLVLILLRHCLESRANNI